MDASSAKKLGTRVGIGAGAGLMLFYNFGKVEARVDNHDKEIVAIKLERKDDRKFYERMERRLWRLEHKANIPEEQIEPLVPPED